MAPVPAPRRVRLTGALGAWRCAAAAVGPLQGDQRAVFAGPPDAGHAALAAAGGAGGPAQRQHQRHAEVRGAWLRLGAVTGRVGQGTCPAATSASCRGEGRLSFRQATCPPPRRHPALRRPHPLPVPHPSRAAPLSPSPHLAVASASPKRPAHTHSPLLCPSACLPPPTHPLLCSSASLPPPTRPLLCPSTCLPSPI